MAQQHIGAAVIVMDQHAVDESTHQHQAQARSAWSRPGRRFAPAALVADLDAQRVGLDPVRHVDDAGLRLMLIGVFDRVRRRLADG
jgi:hypothetical protein